MTVPSQGVLRLPEEGMMMEDKSQTLKVEVIKSQPDSRNRTDPYLRKMVFIKQGNIDGILHMSKF